MKTLFSSFIQWFCFAAGVLLSTASVLAQGTWAAGTNLPVPRIYGAAAEFNGKIYFFGGTAVPPDIADSTIYVYDTATTLWTLEGYMPKSLVTHSCAVVKDTIYIFGGASTVFGAPNEKVYAYDPVDKTWKQKADMPTPRSFMAANMLNDKIYAIAGSYGGFSTATDVEVYDPVLNAWEKKNPFPIYVADAAACTVEQVLFVIGGTQYVPFAGLSYTVKYDAGNDKWIAMTSMPTPRWGAPAVCLNNKIYVIGGSSDIPGDYDVVEVFEPEASASGIWTTETPMPAARRSLDAVALGGKIYAIGGRDDLQQLILSKVEVFTPGVSAVGDLPGAEAEILQVYPNPVSQRAWVRYLVSEAGYVEILIYDIHHSLRQRLAGSRHAPGEYSVFVDVAGLENGVYLCVLRNDSGFVSARKMVVLR